MSKALDRWIGTSIAYLDIASTIEYVSSSREGDREKVEDVGSQNKQSASLLIGLLSEPINVVLSYHDYAP